MMTRTQKQIGYTLIEMLTALGIIALLAAIAFPVFNSVRRRAAQTTCVSNLKQIGLAVSAYAQDNDQVYPLGGDPGDVNTNTWETAFSGQYAAQAKTLRPLQVVLFPYTKQNAVWQCPSDIGGSQLDFSGDDPLAARSSYYEVYGCSYVYRTQIAFEQKTVPGLVAYDDFPPYAEHGPAEVNILSDGRGAWHGDSDEADFRYNTLMGDGHVVNLTHSALSDAWDYDLDLPQVPTPPS